MINLSLQLNEWQSKFKKVVGKGGACILEELEGYKREIFCLKEQLDAKSTYIQSMQIYHEKYKNWSEEKLREFERNLSYMSSYIRKYNQTDFSLKTEIDNYRFCLEEAEKR
ncbi:hypothetical protein CHS0354_031161 [Potamilus streckersoni]|uniref:Uncharacterized protein n=1 Tax=Potamilus streckersoni TaxID=2493646 RepID=A0AAE0WGQ5_9BIVA|nr:hypothetical protein CHS0354_031161 [Potamilus streckersoni]